MRFSNRNRKVFFRNNFRGIRPIGFAGKQGNRIVGEHILQIRGKALVFRHPRPHPSQVLRQDFSRPARIVGTAEQIVGRGGGRQGFDHFGDRPSRKVRTEVREVGVPIDGLHEAFGRHRRKSGFHAGCQRCSIVRRGSVCRPITSAIRSSVPPMTRQATIFVDTSYNRQKTDLPRVWILRRQPMASASSMRSTSAEGSKSEPE